MKNFGLDDAFRELSQNLSVKYTGHHDTLMLLITFFA